MYVYMITDNKRIPVSMVKLLIGFTNKVCYGVLITSLCETNCPYRQMMNILLFPPEECSCHI